MRKKCGKKLTARTLHFSHMGVCPASEDKPPVNQRKKEDAKPVNNDEQVQEANEPKLEKIGKRHDTLNTLVSSVI